MMGENQMYPWIDKCVNPLAGECQHKCVYCYVQPMKKRFDHKNAKTFPPKFPDLMAKYSGEPRIDEKGMAAIKGEGKTIFVCSATDLFAENVGLGLIYAVLKRCCDYPCNTYLFQTKNPARYLHFLTGISAFPPDTILGATIEGTYAKHLSDAPSPAVRILSMQDVADYSRKMIRYQPKTHISIEPITTWVGGTIDLIGRISPGIISIGANTSDLIFNAPAVDDLLYLIDKMRQITPDVRLKDNLKRILGDAELLVLQTKIAVENNRITDWAETAT